MGQSAAKITQECDVDAIVIGRNEGARLVACLQSLGAAFRRVIYVDSGSQDGSVAVAAALGAEVVALDMAQPFTAARARNAGLAKAMDTAEPAALIQFFDGDCQMQPQWLAEACAFLAAHPQVVAVAGLRQETAPAASIYNRLCDWEWQSPAGAVTALGGDLLVRRSAITAIGGYRDKVIAAEDDEMCQRLRAAGGGLWRLAQPMCRHDADMTRFGQWWRRAVRAGHGFAEVGALHPQHFRAARRRIWLWGVGLPLVFLLGWLISPWLSLAVLALYGLSFGRMALQFRRRGFPAKAALAAGGLITLSKFPNLLGMLRYHWRKARAAAPKIIEYK